MARAPASQAGRPGFDSRRLHFFISFPNMESSRALTIFKIFQKETEQWLIAEDLDFIYIKTSFLNYYSSSVNFQQEIHVNISVYDNQISSLYYSKPKIKTLVLVVILVINRSPVWSILLSQYLFTYSLSAVRVGC